MKTIPIRRIANNEKEEGSLGKFNIREIKSVLAGHDLVQDLHRHDFYYLLALQKGKGTHLVDFKTYNIENNTIFFLRPGQVHKLILKAGSTGYLVVFNLDYYYPKNTQALQRLRKASNKNICILDNTRSKKIADILGKIFSEFIGKEEAFNDAIRANLDLLFIELARQRRNKIKGAQPANPYMQDKFEEFSELLEQNLITNKKVSYYSDMMNLSLYQLNEIVKASIGKTGSEFINEYIILEAKRYLLATSNQVKEISYQLGYEDVSYFIRFFKKHTGFSPDAFRQKFG